MGLDRQLVVRAAVDLADTDGVDRLSMRRLAQHLGVTPMAIYYHVPSKDALIDLVVDESLRVVPIADPLGDPLVEVRRTFGALFQLLIDHPGLAAAFGSRPLGGPVARRIGEGTLQLLRRNGLADDDAARLLVSLAGFTLGSALYRSSRGDAGRFFDATIETPLVHRLGDRLTAVAKDDRQFDDGIAALLVGYDAIGHQAIASVDDVTP
jgi:AcrR family transcriptional regulator